MNLYPPDNHLAITDHQLSHLNTIASTCIAVAPSSQVM